MADADVTTKNEYKIKKYKENFEVVGRKLKEVEEKDSIRNWQPPVTGEDIMKTFELKPGREVGEIKNAIREAILEGEVKNEFNSAYEFMIRKGREMGLEQKHKLTRSLENNKQ